MQSSSFKVIQQLRQVVGDKFVLTHEQDTRLYRQGRRFGEGRVLAVVVPGSLIEQWRVLQLVVAADCIVIMQGSQYRTDRRLDPIWE